MVSFTAVETPTTQDAAATPQQGRSFWSQPQPARETDDGVVVVEVLTASSRSKDVLLLMNS